MKNEVPFGKAALRLLCLKQAVIDAGMEYVFINNICDNPFAPKDYIKKVRNNFKDASWYRFGNELIDPETNKRDYEAFASIDKKLAVNVKEETAALWNVVLYLNQNDEDLSKDQRNSISDIWIDFYQQVRCLDVKEPSLVENTQNWLGNKARYHAASAYKNSCVYLNQKQAKNHMQIALETVKQTNNLTL